MPPSRWVVNFDYDLLDGLVLAAVVAAHVPFLVSVFDSYICVYLRAPQLVSISVSVHRSHDNANDDDSVNKVLG